MPSSDLLSYVGAITGPLGLLISLLAFWRSGKFKAIDLRLRLRTAQSTLQADAEELAPLLEHAKKSHAAVAAASGSHGSGATKHWMTEWEEDKANAGELHAAVVAFQKDCSRLTHTALESELVAAHNVQRKIDTLKNKYLSSLAQDEKQRERINQDHRTTIQALIGKKQ